MYQSVINAPCILWTAICFILQSRPSKIHHLTKKMLFTIKITAYFLHSWLNQPYFYISGSTKPTILTIITVFLSHSKKQKHWTAIYFYFK